MNIKKFRINFEVFIFFIFIFITSSVLFITPYKFDIWILLSFILNGILWLFLLFRELQRYRFSFCLIKWFFFYVFFFVAAYAQYANNKFPWQNIIDVKYILISNIVLFVYTLFFLLGTKVPDNYIKRQYIFDNVNTSFFKIINITVINFFILLYKLSTFGLVGLFSKHSSGIMAPQAVLSVLMYIFLGFIFYGTVLCINNYKITNNKKYFYLFIINFIMLFIAYSPFSVSRYMAGSVYLSILIFIFIDKFTKSNIFSIVFVLGIFIVWPFLNAFRHTEFSDVDIIVSLLNLLNNFNKNWLAGDYDAYSMLSMTIQYIEIHGCTWLYQLIGSILFFIPRIIWTTKPVGSGYMISQTFGYSFNNVSCPLPGECIINLGYIGIIIFPFLLGIFLRKLDIMYWSHKIYNTKYALLYPILAILFFMVCRGDLMSGMSFVMGFTFSWVLLVLL